MKRQMILKLILVLLIICSFKITGSCKGGKDWFNAEQLSIGNQDDPSIASGQEQWYYFTTNNNPDDEWVILRVVGLHERGVISFEIMDEQLNVVKGCYSLSGTHTGEIVCRMDTTIEGTIEPFIPRLLRDRKYYIRLRGNGTFSINLSAHSDDYPGGYRKATTLVVGTPITGNLERDDDIDSFKFDVPDGQAYNIRVYASKKMNVRISDSDNYLSDNNSLRVMRDFSTSQYTISGYGTIRYFFLYGSGGTNYKIDVTTATISDDSDQTDLGSWTKVTVCRAGLNYIRVRTLKGSKVIITVKKGKGNKRLVLRSNRKTIKKVTQKSKNKNYYLNRSLQPGDVVKISIYKARYRDFHYKKKIKR